MEKDKIERINELARKKKTEGLSDDERDEHEELRKEYIALFRANVAAQLDNVYMQQADGTYEKLKKKQ